LPPIIPLGERAHVPPWSLRLFAQFPLNELSDPLKCIFLIHEVQRLLLPDNRHQNIRLSRDQEVDKPDVMGQNHHASYDLSV